MPHCLAARTNDGGLGSQMTVRVDFNLDAAVAKNTLRDHGHHINAPQVGGDNQRGRFVIWIARSRADCSDEHLGIVEDVSAPFSVFVKWDELAAPIYRALKKEMGINPHQFPGDVS